VLTAARRQRGMTLIELLIGLALVAMLILMAVPSFTTAAHNRTIRNAADAIQNGMTLARTEALRRNRTVRFQTVGAGGWTVGCDPADATIVNGEENCPAVLQTRNAADGSANATVANVQLAADGTAAAAPIFAGSLRFTPLGRVTTDTLPGGQRAVFRITNPNGGACQAAGGEMRCLDVVVTSAGQGRTCDPAVAAGDPRAC
jgi:type IV fimbrial biogenesis protein FimT